MVMRVRWCFGALLLLLAVSASAQESQFAFDASGNFLSEFTESPALPQIIGQPQTQVVIPGNHASFSVGVADTSGVSYQWFFNSTAIPGATADSLLLTNVNTANEGPYWVAVSNSFGSVASVLANLYMDSRGCGMPDSWQMQYFGNLNQPADEDYDGDGVANLQEFLDGTNPTNAASALYRITLVNDGGTVVTSPNQAAYTNGQSVTLTATSTNSNPFHAWTGGFTTRSNLITVTMTNNLELFAHFLPFTLIWTNPANGDWNGASNWSPNLVPGAGESVVIQNQTTVTENSNVDLVNFTLGNPTLTAGLTGTGIVTIAGTGYWYNGTMSGSGATVVKPGAMLALANGSGLALSDRTIENAGLLVWGGGSISFGGIITNDPGGQIQFFANASINYGGGVARLDNAGTFIAATNGTTIFQPGVAFDNYGTVTLPGGTLALDGGGVEAGPIGVAAGAAINFQGGTFTSTGNLSLTGPGTLIVSGGAATLGGTIDLTGSNIFSPGGGVDFTGNYICTNNSMLISGGSASFDGTGVVSPAYLTLSSDGSLGGAQNVTVLNAMGWTGGAMTGTGQTIIPTGVTLSISNSSPISLTSRTLYNAGTAVWNGTGILTMNTAVITNTPGALFQIQGPQSVNFGGGASRFDNAGTLRITGSGTTSIGGAQVNNFNLVDIQGGTLALTGGGSQSGTMNVPAGTAVNLGGTFTSTSSSSITGAGQLIVSGGILNLAGTVNVTGSNIFSPAGGVDFTGNYICTNNSMLISGASASFDGTGMVSPTYLTLNVNGTLGGSQNVTVGSAMSWLGGNMTGAGRSIIPPGATLSTSNALPVIMTSRILDNGGTVLWIGAGSVSMSGAVISNRPGAFFNVQNSVNWTGGGSPRIDNAGTFRKSGSSGTMTLSGITFTNYGTADIQSGVLVARSGYGSSPNAILNCGIGGPVAGMDYGQLQVSGAVTLNGALDVNFNNNFYPALNESFTVVTAGTRNGAFSTFLYPSNEITMTLSNTATSVILTATNLLAVPPPFLLSPQLSGSNVILTWTSVSNGVYRLEFNPVLSGSNWSALAGDVTAYSNTASKTDSLTSSNRYYRVQGFSP
jgi:hypothetical protein